MSEIFVQSFEHLRDFPRADEALTRLKKVASLVKPIMRKHGWRLPTLAEFFPEMPNLLGLNVNMGQKIMVRLRPAFDRGAFLQEHEVIGTMLHELTHNVHGPHDQQFYKFLAGLEDEFAALQRSGYAGEGFFTPGRRLGSRGGRIYNVPPQVARLRALEAAEQRRKYGSMLGGGGRLGGGDLGNLGLSMRELTALAADMRSEDAKRCATGDKTRQDEEVERAKRESIRTAGFELSEHGDEIEVFDGPYFQETNTPRLPSASSRPQPLTSRSASSAPPAINMSSRPSRAELSTWTCSACTLINKGSGSTCEVCDAPRPGQTSSGPYAPPDSAPPPTARSRNASAPSHDTPKQDLSTWDCLVCGEQGMQHEFWTCRWCGSVKQHS